MEFDLENDSFDGRIPKESRLGRSLFLSEIPKGIENGSIIECSCPTCRDGFRAKDVLDHLETIHKNKCSDSSCLLEICDLRASILSDESISDAEFFRFQQDFSKLEPHKTIVEIQRNAFRNDLDSLKQRTNTGTGQFDSVILFDFSPYKGVYDKKRPTRYDKKRSMSESLTIIQALHIVLFLPDPSESRWDSRFSILTSIHLSQTTLFSRDELSWTSFLQQQEI